MERPRTPSPRLTSALALLSLLFVGPADAEEPALLTRAAAGWLASLDASQRSSARYAFDDGERFDLRLAPLFLEGLRRDAMTPEQWAAWARVLESGLSPVGVRKVETIMSLEREVRVRDRASLTGRIFGGFVHGEHRYYVALFGEPVPGSAWGLRFDGHHLSLNWTVGATGAVSLTPVFLGSEPREVSSESERAGLRALPDEEDRGHDLWRSLGSAQRSRAELPFTAASGPGGGNRPLFLGGAPEVEATTPVGIARGQLEPGQRLHVDALLDAYLATFTPRAARAYREGIDAAGRDRIHFAFAGSLTPGEPGYYRLHGPTILIEWDNTLPAADHVHTIVRDLRHDFGRDLLAEHYARSPHHGAALRRASR